MGSFFLIHSLMIEGIDQCLPAGPQIALPQPLQDHLPKTIAAHWAVVLVISQIVWMETQSFPYRPPMSHLTVHAVVDHREISHCEESIQCVGYIGNKINQWAHLCRLYTNHYCIDSTGGGIWTGF